jgi:hypothetical protein
VLENSARLLDCYTREPSYEVRKLCAVFEVLKEGGDGHTSTTKYPSATHFLRITFYGRARRPIVHGLTLDLLHTTFQHGN